MLFLLPLALPIPFMVLLHVMVPLIDLAPATADVMLFANQLIGVAFLLIVCGFAMLDHARARRIAEDRAEALTRVVEDLSHELRTPIATVLTAAQGARGREAMDEPIGENLEWIEDSSRAAGRLVERMLDLAALDRGRRPEPRLEALPRAVLQAVNRLRPFAEARALELRFRPEAEPKRTVDAASLDIVLQNLVTNALAHSPPKGSVEIRLTESA
ncbi:MAG: HAMP domain-containing histidine kinase, partial [Thermoanaerobaculia bacterium]|nr:HAMP domain-containing histidine kinase [Thermoanaerobaculia bacterium]